MALRVRIALPKDKAQIMKMMYKAHQESPRYRRFVFNKEATEKIVDTFLATTAARGDQIGLVCEDTVKRGISGVFALSLQSHLWCGGTYVIDFVQYVKPAYRGGTTFIRLIDAAEQWAISRGADELIFGVSSGYKAEKNVKLYQRLGYAPSVHSAIKSFTL